jgi:hypothetical protein
MTIKNPIKDVRNAIGSFRPVCISTEAPIKTLACPSICAMDVWVVDGTDETSRV